MNDPTYRQIGADWVLVIFLVTFQSSVTLVLNPSKSFMGASHLFGYDSMHFDFSVKSLKVLRTVPMLQINHVATIILRENSDVTQLENLCCKNFHAGINLKSTDH